MIKTKMESEIINRKMSLSSKVSSISSWEWLSKGQYNITSEMVDIIMYQEMML